MRIGVIIPTLDEEDVIERTLRTLLQRGRPAIVVVADCGSLDRTIALAQQFDVVTLSDSALNTRAKAMNVGAARALRDCPGLEALWFLHADSIPPHEWDSCIADGMNVVRVVGGAFDIRWNYEGVDLFRRTKLAFFQRINRFRFHLTHIFFGDQGIFVRPDAFEEVGHMPHVDLLEDVLLCRLLKRRGRLILARGVVRTNPRRFLKHGVCRQVMLDVWLLLSERLGLRQRRLHEWYNQEKAYEGRRSVSPDLGDSHIHSPR
ncbi:MAG: glycosyltransferase [Planctomycetota bacterium]|nr:glycosyltransferase [Planctomycetota bacterium]